MNGRHLRTVYNDKVLPFYVLANISAFHKSTSVDSILKLIVENMGRSSFGLLDNQRKCFQGSVSVDGNKAKEKWEHFSIDFSTAFLKAVRQSRDWIPTVRPSLSSQGQPTLYRGHFNIKQLKNTYIDMSNWTKGAVIVNGFVLGRYWNIGPQQSLYVPSPILMHGVGVKRYSCLSWKEHWTPAWTLSANRNNIEKRNDNTGWCKANHWCGSTNQSHDRHLQRTSDVVHVLQDEYLVLVLVYLRVG